MVARMNAAEANKQGISNDEVITISQGEQIITMPFEIDDDIADGCLYVAAGTVQTQDLETFSNVQVSVGTQP